MVEKGSVPVVYTLSEADALSGATARLAQRKAIESGVTNELHEVARDTETRLHVLTWHIDTALRKDVTKTGRRVKGPLARRRQLVFQGKVGDREGMPYGDVSVLYHPEGVIHRRAIPDSYIQTRIVDEGDLHERKSHDYSASNLELTLAGGFIRHITLHWNAMPASRNAALYEALPFLDDVILDSRHFSGWVSLTIGGRSEDHRTNLSALARYGPDLVSLHAEYLYLPDKNEEHFTNANTNTNTNTRKRPTTILERLRGRRYRPEFAERIEPQLLVAAADQMLDLIPTFEPRVASR